jgi:hypothetical protein
MEMKSSVANGFLSLNLVATNFRKSVVLFWISLFGLGGGIVDAADDKELLLQAAKVSESNRASIKTWQGQVEIKDTDNGSSRGLESNFSTTSVVNFYYDREKGKLLYSRKFSQEGIKMGVKQRGQVYFTAGLRSPEGYFSVPYWSPEDPKGLSRPVLMIGKRSDEITGRMGRDFDPFVFFELLTREDLSTVFRAFYNRPEETPRIYSVKRIGDIVTLYVSIDKTSGFNQYEVNLAQGGNPVSVKSVGPNVRTTYLSEFEKIDNVWVPKKSTYLYDCNKPQLTKISETRWISNIINRPIADDVFSLEKLGMSRGDTVIDVRRGAQINYLFGDKK